MQGRIDQRIAELDLALTAETRANVVARIPHAEEARGPKTAVSGFDLTFSVPKSVSALWGLADADLQTPLGQGPHAAVPELMNFLERAIHVTSAVANPRNAP